MSGKHTVSKVTGGLDTPSQKRLSAWCKAMAHPVRVRLVQWLVREGDGGGWVCNELVKRLPLAQSTVSEHLRILRDSGLILREVHGTRSRYSVNRDALETMKRMLSQL